MDSLLEQFLGEARENLSFLDKNLGNLANGDKDEINALFRAAHTLKGGAGLIGLETIKNITHYAEDLFDGIRKGEIEYEEDMLDVLYDAFDEIIEMVDATEELGEIPEFDEQRVAEIANSIKEYLNIQVEEINPDALDTELQFITENQNIGNLISHYNISSFVNELSLKIKTITQDFIEDDNIYLIDMDLDEEACQVGNDPVYLAYLLGEDSILSISSCVYNCEDLNQDATLWKTRISMVVKSNKDVLEDSLYNIIDQAVIYPLSIKSLLSSEYKNINNEIYDDFVVDFKNALENKEFSKLNEKLSAVTKILNLESKEGFCLRRLELILPYFEFESEDYLSIINMASVYLGITEEVSDSIEETADEESLDEEKTVVLNALKQQLKVLKFAKDEMAISRVRLHSKTSLEFIDVEPNFHNDDDKYELANKIIYYILEINPNEDVEQFRNEFIKRDEETKSIKSSENSESLQVDEDIVENIESSEKLEIKEEFETQEIEELSTNDEIEIVQEVEEIKEVQEIQEEPEVNIKVYTTTGTQEENIEKNKTQETSKDTKAETTTARNTIPKTVKIDQSDIDSMMDIIGELLVMKNALPYVAEKINPQDVLEAKTELLAKYEEINRVTEQLQDIVMGMRLLPLSYIFSRYPKLIRETSKKLNKKIKFEEYGAETKLDKMMIEKIADPLVHIIRNSLDHGIEAIAEDRIANGKDPVGMIKIGAKSEGDKVKIIIEDDGRGINVPKVLAKAIQLGIITEEQIDSMSEQDKLQMIFNPGLSTAEQITDISGRGVGTDAVKKTIEELNGNIILESQTNIGTTVVIELPVSVALTNVFCVKMGTNNYAVAMENVLETIKLNHKDMQIAMNKPYVRLRGELIPLIFEEKLLGIKDYKKDNYSIVIVQGSSLRYGLVVDEFINQLDVVQKPLEGAIANHPMISGTSLLGNGEILFILDTNGLVS